MRRFQTACIVVLAAAAASALAQSSTLPSSVVDAQIPMVSTDGFSSPQGVAVAQGGVVYVADTGKHRVLVFAYGGAQATVSLGSFGPPLLKPTGVALDGATNLYVTDTDTNRLIKLRAPIGTLNALTIIGPEILDRPTGVASDAAGNLAIINSGNAKIIVRRAAGKAVVFNTGTTTLVTPTTVAFDDLGDLYIADAGNGMTPSAIYHFPKLGGSGVNLAPAGYDLKTIKGLALDDARNLYILDGASKQLIEVPASGGAAFLVPQSNFFSPSGLAIDNLGNLYVSDSTNTLTKLVYNNAVDFGSIKVGMPTAPITFNYEFYQPTTVKARRGIGGGVWNAEYKVGSGGTCSLRTYYPSTSGTGRTLPAACTANFTFTPNWVNGRPGAVQVETTNGNVTQLTIGVGRGAQLAVLNATVSTKLADAGATAMIVNAASTQIYYSGIGGTYRQPAGGGASTLLSTYTGKVAVNGAGDVYILNTDDIVRVPGDGGAQVVTRVRSIRGVVRPTSVGIDANGAIYIADAGSPDEWGTLIRGFMLRISPTGGVTKIYPNGWLFTPANLTWDYKGDVYFIDAAQRLIFGFAAWKGDFTLTTSPVTVGGSGGADPVNLAVEDNNTYYYWDVSDFGFGLTYAPPLLENYPLPYAQVQGEFTLPVLTVPGIVAGLGNYLPFLMTGGEQTLVSSPSGKLYAQDGSINGWHLIDRTHGLIPKEAFQLYFQNVGGPTTSFYLYNLGNENLTFTSPSNLFTQSGSGVGTFTFDAIRNSTTPVCVVGGTIAAGGVCRIDVTSLNAYGSGPTVTDTLHFLTDAANNSTVTFAINGAGRPTP